MANNSIREGECRLFMGSGGGVSRCGVAKGARYLTIVMVLMCVE